MAGCSPTTASDTAGLPVDVVARPVRLYLCMYTPLERALAAHPLGHFVSLLHVRP